MTTASAFVEYDYREDVRAAVITLARPDGLNALDQALCDALLEKVDRAARDSRVRSVILTSRGRAFAAGADIRELEERTWDTAKSEPGLRRVQLTRELESMPVPSIAALNGPAIGGGLEIALACSVRIAVPGASFALPEVGLGIIPGNGGTQRLPRLVGLGNALEMILTGAHITAERALAIGLITRIVAPDRLLETACEYAQAFAGKSRRALAAAKSAVLAAADNSLQRGLEYEHNLFAHLCDGPDKAEGVAAFLAKRKPNYAD